MSQENLAAVRRSVAAFNVRDVDAFAEPTTADFEWFTSMSAIEGEVFRGRAGIDTYFDRLAGVWERFLIHPDELRERADVVVVLGRLEGCGKGSGVSVDSPLGMVYEFRNGAISRIRGFLDHSDALQAAGLPG